MNNEGILLVDKPKGKTSFSLIGALRRLLGVQKIGHSGTLDPLATGVMVILVGKKYTRLSDQFISHEKEYEAEIILGASTNTYDAEGEVTQKSDKICSESEVKKVIDTYFQGQIEQIPPMFSAKKIKGQKLYDLARKGIEIERKAVQVTVKTELLDFQFPKIHLKVACSKGTYIRSIAHDLGNYLGCYAYLNELKRTQSGQFHINQCVDGSLLFQADDSQDVCGIVKQAFIKV